MRQPIRYRVIIRLIGGMILNDNKLTQNFKNLQSNIPNHVTLIAVTKQVDAKVNRHLFDLGLRDFAENRPQNFLEKYEALADLNAEIKWHFIGNLQTRPLKNIINKIDYLHSLDRISLAKEIQKRADQPIACFLQVNVSGEETKSGFQPKDVLETIYLLKDYDKIQIIGLMTMAPYDASPDQLHSYFRDLRSLQAQVAQEKLDYAPCTELSMGMSQDYQIAIEEGATFVRIGTALYQ